MRVLCRSGHFAFYPRTSSDLARFSKYFAVSLKRENDYYTFEGLFGAKNYSLLGKPYLNLPALKTFEGSPWDVMKANDFVYHIGLGIIVPKLAVIGVVDLPLIGFYFRSKSPLLQPGVRTILGRQIMSYAAEFVYEGDALRVLEFGYE